MKKKGFTLIELLAVIIILAVIALIATPVILNVINKSREEARKDSVMGYADAVRLSYAEEQMNNTGKPIQELANQKMSGEEVACTSVIFNQRYGTMLHGCNVEEVGNYCYFRGIVYEGESAECDNVSKIITSGEVPYNPPSMTTPTQYPEGSEYAQRKDIKIEFPSLGIVDERYFIKVSESVEINNVIAKCDSGDLPVNCVSSNETTLEPNVWYELSGEAIFTITQNIVIETVIGNEGSFGNKTIYTELKMDTTEPSANVSSVSTKTNSATVIADCKDSESGITKYEYSMDGTTWTPNGETSSYTFENLEQNKEYAFYVRCTNGSLMTKESGAKTATTATIVAPESSQTAQTPSTGTYATERVVTVTYSNEGVENPEYYLKTDVAATVSSSDIIATCGTGTEPGECVAVNEVAMVGSIASSDTMSLVSNTWYQTGNKTIKVTFASNGKLYAQTKDATGNKMDSSTYTIANVDTVAPGVSVSVSGKVATITLTDNYAVVGYGVNQSNTTAPTYTGVSQTTSTSVTYTATAGGTYYAWVKDSVGKTSNVSFKILNSAFNYAATSSQTSANYAATGTTKEKCYSVSLVGTKTSDGQTWYCHGGSDAWRSCSSSNLSACCCRTAQVSKCCKNETTYSCPNGGTLSGSTCLKTVTTYSCPNGGTLSGTTCVFAD